MLPPTIYQVLLDKMILSRGEIKAWYKEMIIVLHSLQVIANQQRQADKVSDVGTSFAVLTPTWSQVYHDLPETTPVSAVEQRYRDDRKDELMIQYMAGWGLMNITKHRRFHVYLTNSPREQPSACGHVRLRMTMAIYEAKVAAEKAMESHQRRNSTVIDTTPKTPGPAITPRSPSRRV